MLDEIDLDKLSHSRHVHGLGGIYADREAR